jgi:hypothetical protein
MEPSRHTAIVRLLKMWAMRVGEHGYAQRVTVDDVLADDIVEAVIRNDLLREFDPADDAERLKRRALDRVRDRGRGSRPYSRSGEAGAKEKAPGRGTAEALSRSVTFRTGRGCVRGEGPARRGLQYKRPAGAVRS